VSQQAMPLLNAHLHAILAIVKKDIRELMPLVLLALAVFLIHPAIQSMNFDVEPEFWLTIQANFYWVGYFLGALLMVSVLQLDPAASLNHDWLSRPISRLDWLLAKLFFLVLTVCIPVILSRILLSLINDLGLLMSIKYAFALEKLSGAYPVPLLFAAALLAPTSRKLIMLLTLTLFIFLVPAFSVTSPILEMLGIDLGRVFATMVWLQTLLLFILGTVGCAAIYWLYYCRREQRRASFAFWAIVTLMFLVMYPPSSLYNMDREIMLLKAMVNGDEEVSEDAVVLAHTLACFPAVAGDSHEKSEFENSILAQAAWVDGWRRMSDAGGITFATMVNVRTR